MNLIGHKEENRIVFVPNEATGVHRRVFEPILRELKKRGVEIKENAGLELAESRFHIKEFWYDALNKTARFK